jgi:hypothetical protein
MMTNDLQNAGRDSEDRNAGVEIIPDIKKLTRRLRLAKEHKRIVRHAAAEEQVKIMLHVYYNEGVSLKKIRPLFKLSDITLFRHMGALRKVGFVIWKGSHKNGGYVMTDKGKEFVEKNR